MAENGTEFELKLIGPARVIAELPDGPLMRAVAGEGGRWRRLSTEYWDTPDSALKKAGLSLRRRHDRDVTTQTVKIGEGASRREVETLVAPGVEFPVTTAVPEIDDLLIAHVHDLAPILQMNIDRWSAETRFRNAIIEISVDLGSAIIKTDCAGGQAPQRERHVPIAELELELRDGKLEDVFSMAKLFMSSEGLRLHGHSKLARAKAALDGAAAHIPSRRKISVAPEETAARAVQRALVASAERIVALQPAITEMRAPAGIHQMRVELRRFRAIERIIRRAVADNSLSRLAGKARGIGRALGPARDWDVFLDEMLPIIDDYHYSPAGVSRLRAAGFERRAAAWADAVETVASDAFGAFTLDLMQAAYCAPWAPRAETSNDLNAPARIFAAKALERGRRKVTRTARNIDASDAAGRHPLRVALKKLRYSVQLFRTLYPKEARRPYMNAMADLQQSFGEINDAVTAQRLVNDIAKDAGPEAKRAAGFIIGYFAAQAEHAALSYNDEWAHFENIEPFWRD